MLWNVQFNILFFCSGSLSFLAKLSGVLRFTNRLVSTADFTIGTTVCLSPRKNGMCMPALWEQSGLWWSHFSELGDAKPCPEIQNTQGLSEINMTKCHIIMQYFMHFLPWRTKEVTELDIHMSVHRNIIPNYSQLDATFLEFNYFYRRSTCFRRFLRPSSGAHNKSQPTRCNVPWFIYFYRRSTCFRRFLRPSSGAHNCIRSFRYCQPILLLAATVEEMALQSRLFHSSSRIGWQYLKLYIQLCAPDDGRRNRLKHVERL